MPRSKLPARRDVHLRIPEDVFANVVLLRPELVDPGGQFRYGAINAYFIKLLQRDIEARLARLTEAKEPPTLSSASQWAPFPCTICGVMSGLDSRAGQDAHLSGAPHDHNPKRPR